MRRLFAALTLWGVALTPGQSFAKPPLIRLGQPAKEVTVENREAVFRVRLKGTQSSLLTVDLYGGETVEIEGEAKDLLLNTAPKKWRFPFIKQETARATAERRGCLSVAVELPEEDKWPTFEELGLSTDLFEQFRILFEAINLQLTSTPVVPPATICAVTPTELKQRFLDLMSLALAGRYAWTNEDTCLFLDSEYLDDAYRYFGIATTGSSPQARATRSSSWVAMMRKNACMGEKRGSTYEVVLRARVKGAKKLWVRVSESAPVTARAASIKPVSVGKLAPAPLLLMQSLSLCNQSLNKVVWRRGAPTVSPLSIEDVISYRGLALNRSNASSALTGGWGVFDLDDGRAAYGVCLSLTRTRQRVNGYPLPVSGGQ